MEREFCLNWTALVEEAVRRRQKLKLTQRQLAAIARVSAPTVSRFELAKQDIQLSSVLAILEALGMIDRRTLAFPDPRPRYDFDRDVVVFDGYDGDALVRAAITREALDDHFNGAGGDKVAIFQCCHSTIEAMARKKYLLNAREADGTILIRTIDLI